MSERERLEQAIAALEAQRALLGDAIIEAGLAPMRARLAALHAVAPAEEQRKQATILFADVSGFTALGSTVDAEDLAHHMNVLWQTLDRAITAQGGRIDKHIGDAVMAVWGVEAAREDDPARAIRAALDMQAALAGFHAADMPAPTVRIGLNTGPVRLGTVGTTGEYTAMGDAVNLAKRLEEVAPPGGILISHDTYRHVRGLFDVEVLPPVTLKGKAEPQRVYLVRRAKPRAFFLGSRGVEGVETRMIGREAELLQLQQALRAAIEDRELQTITVVGDAGVGKSRLLYEFRSWVELLPEHVRLFAGRATPEMTRTPYALLRDVFAFRFAIQESDSAAVARAKLEAGVTAILGPERPGALPDAHALGHLLGLDFSASPLLDGLLDDARALHARALAALVDLFEAAAAATPVLVVLEDLHWADDASLDTVAHLIERVGPIPIFVLGLTRPLLFERRPNWGEGQAGHHRLRLRPLSRHDSRRLVEEILQRVPEVPEALRELVVSGAEGNPFYVEELIKMLIETGVIGASGETWQVDPARLAEVRVPPTLLGVLQARLDGLPREERMTLQRAAVIGRVFWDSAVADLGNAAAADEVEQLEVLRRRELVYQRELSTFAEDREFIFKHALLREVTYESILKRQRRTYHARAAEWLLRRSEERVDEYAALIGEHYARAGEAGQAVDYLLRAGDRARGLYAHQEAIASYRRALELLKEQGDQERSASTLMKLGLVYNLAFDYEHAQAAYREAFALEPADGASGVRTRPPAPHPLRIPVVEPLTLDPGRAEDAFSMGAIRLLFSGLVAVTPQLDVVPALARSWEVLEGGRKFVFHLRDDARWSDGRPVMAEDYVYAWRRALEPRYATNAASFLFDLRGALAFRDGMLGDPSEIGVRAPNPFTLVVELEGPTGYFPYLAASVPLLPVPRHVVDVAGPNWWKPETLVTNGAFQLRTWREGNLMMLDRHAAFPCVVTGNVQEVELHMLGDLRSLAVYDCGQLDVAFLSPREIDQARSRYPGEYVTESQGDTVYLGFDVLRPPFNDVRVRRAFALAWNRGAFARGILAGHYLPATGGFVPPGLPGHCPGIAGGYDPELARMLLSDAGYDGGLGLPPISLVCGDNSLDDAWAGFLRAQWREVLGVDIALEPQGNYRGEWEGPVYGVEHAGEPPHLYLTAWVADYPDPDNFLRVGLSDLRKYWHHPVYWDLVEEARRLTDQNARLQRYRQAEHILVEEVAIMPMGYRREHLLVKPWVRNFNSLAGLITPSLENVVIEPHD